MYLGSIEELQGELISNRFLLHDGQFLLGGLQVGGFCRYVYCTVISMKLTCGQLCFVTQVFSPGCFLLKLMAAVALIMHTI